MRKRLDRRAARWYNGYCLIVGTQLRRAACVTRSAEQHIGSAQCSVNVEQIEYARVVELVDSPASGAGVRKDVGVRVPPRAPTKSQAHDKKYFVVGLTYFAYYENNEGSPWVCE